MVRPIKRELLEDQEALASSRYLRRIAKARKDAAAGRLAYPISVREQARWGQQSHMNR